jgi:hypothetical protein
MSKADWSVVALNAFALVLAVMGLTGSGWGNIPLLWATLTLVVNGGWIIRRGSKEPLGPRREDPAALNVALEAHQLLEIDERLATLERRDAERVRELASRGEIRTPAALLVDTTDQQVRQRDRP